MMPIPNSLADSFRIGPKRYLKGAILAGIASLTLLIAGCGGSAGTSSTQPSAPSKLTYSTASFTCYTGQAITTDTPTVTGTVTAYSVSPALPAGLALNATSGAISGTPTAITPYAEYTVEASNASGSTTSVLQIAVDRGAPTNLIYPVTSIVANHLASITPDTPTVTGTVTSFSVSPALPDGLTLNLSTGAISGTPQVLAGLTTYTVTASNPYGSTTATVQIEVLVAKPSITYPNETLTLGAYVPPIYPVIQGQSPTVFSISPALPAGLIFTPGNGEISGNPTALQPLTTYTVSGSNAGGLGTGVFQLSVVIPSPSGLSYAQKSIPAAVSYAITPDVPTVTGTVSAYSVSPALPAGLTLNTTSGVISGTPTAVTPYAQYTVKASNASGSTTVIMPIAVKGGLPPTNLVYPVTSIVANDYVTIAPDTPTVTGNVTSFSISPELSDGLTVDASTGTISGTPQVVTGPTTYTLTANNPYGFASATVQIEVLIAKPKITYPREMLILGAYVAPIYPVIQGQSPTVFSISPALPAGLVFTPANGAISGTPTALQPFMSYTVSGSNAGGLGTGILQLAVVIPAPSGLNYAQGTISAVVAQAITPDAPTVTGTVSAYSVSPALPAGLSLDPTTGIISGTPTTAAASAQNTITASNATGSTTAKVTISVSQPHTSMIDLGHTAQIAALRMTGDRVLSSDYTGHWVLWNYSTGDTVASGDGLNGSIDLAGELAVAATNSGLQLIDASTGATTATVPSGTWWRLASDGSYVCTGSATGLTVWLASGDEEITRAGDYSAAIAFAAPGQVQVAMGPAGASVIETISLPSGTSNVSPAFSGTFNSWFTDGNRFLTNTGTTVWVYSSAVVQQALVSLPTVQNLTGQGNWLWTYQPAGGAGLQIYAIGSSTPAQTYPLKSYSLSSSGTTIGAIDLDDSPQVSVIDLSGAAPAKTDYVAPSSLAYISAFGAVSSSQWIAGNENGLILDGASLSGTPKFFGYGAALSIAGTSDVAAIATASGKILLFDPSGPTQDGSIGFLSGKLALSSDGSVLGASNYAEYGQPGSDLTLNFYSLPSNTVISSFLYPIPAPSSYSTAPPFPVDFSLSGSGSVIGQEFVSFTSNLYTEQVTGISGSPDIWSSATGSANKYPILLSPDGTLIAMTSGGDASSITTNIYRNGALVTAVPGEAQAWIDNGQLLVATVLDGEEGPYLNGAMTTYSPDGTVLATVGLPLEFTYPQIVGTSEGYSGYLNAIYSLTTGSLVWQGPSAVQYEHPVGAVAGPYVVYELGHLIVRDSY
jgi:hypothetical protein